MIHLYVTHHVTSDLEGINDLLIDQLWRMRDLSASPIFVACWTDEARYLADLHDRLPPDIKILFNDRPGRPDIQPSLRNLVVEHARAAASCEAFVLLHNDVKLARGALRNLVGDWRAAEARWGKDSSIVSPRFIPYHVNDPVEPRDKAFWAALADNQNVYPASDMAMWCMGWNFGFEQGPWTVGNISSVIAPEQSEITDDGHQLMMFIASPRFFDDVGLCDEAFTGVNYDDSDWGVRALLAGKKNLQSTGALVGHIAGMSFRLAHRRVAGPKEPWRTVADNAAVFVAKHGQAMFDELQDGTLWTRLHREQREREAEATR